MIFCQRAKLLRIL